MAATTPDSDGDTDPEPAFDDLDGEGERNDSETESVCGAPTGDGSPCQRETENGQPCFMHGDDGPPADHGAPEGNQNGEDNAGGGAPEDNDNALKHGAHTATGRRLEIFDDKQLAVFGDYYAEFLVKVETESAAARLASLAVIADELEADLLQNGVFRDVLDVGDGSGEGRPAGQSPQTETLNALLRVLRELRLGKDAEGVTGNDLSDENRLKNHFSVHMDNQFGEKDELAWRQGTPAVIQIDPEQLGDNHRREPPRFPPGPGSPPDDLGF